MKAPAFWGRPPGLASAVLGPAAWAYAAAGWLRWRLSRPEAAPVPVLCVGNLTAGGSGKTPVVRALAAMLAGAGHRPHILTRGHGGRVRGPHRADPTADGAARIGDEALMLARDGTPVWIGADRRPSARLAARAGASLLILDDGFQNPGLAKTCSLVVADGSRGFGNGRVHPAGPLREPVARGLARADAVVILHRPGQTPAGEAAVRRHAERAGLPVFTARLEPSGTSDPLKHSGPVLAFAGIGHQEGFFATLRHQGIPLAATRAFPDHHPYSTRDLDRLTRDADRLGARLVTTEKDWVRLPAHVRERTAVVTVTCRFDAPDAVGAFLDARLTAAPRADGDLPESRM